MSLYSEQRSELSPTTETVVYSYGVFKSMGYKGEELFYNVKRYIISDFFTKEQKETVLSELRERSMFVEIYNGLKDII